MSDDREFELLDALLDQAGVGRQAVAAIPRRGATSAPLSPAQRRLWFLAKLDPQAAGYSIAGAALLRGRLDEAALQFALDEVVRRHEALRTTYPEYEGEPRQVIHAAAPVQMVRVEGDPGHPAQEAARIAGELARRPWDLARGPLLRVALVAFGPDTHALALALHHIGADGWSMGIVLREIGDLYAAGPAGPAKPARTAEPPELAEPPVQYADYAAWQLQRLEDGALDPQIDFWRAALRDAPTLLALPATGRRASHAERRAATVRFPLEADLAEALIAVAHASGATPFAALLCCYQALLARWTGQSDLLVGVPIANRDQPQTAGVVGLFVNTLPVRAQLADDPTLAEVMVRARDSARAALAHAEAPFERIVDAVSARRVPGSTPLVQALFAYQDEPPTGLQMSGLTVEPIDVDDATAMFDMTLSIERRGGGFACALEVDEALLDRATARRMAAHFVRLAGALAAGGGARVSAHGLLSDAQAQQLVADLSATPPITPLGETVHALFQAQVARTPDAVALSGTDSSLTYAQLATRAQRVANALRAAGAGPEVVVGLCIDRSPGMVVAMLGILKAGAAWLPLDPAHPQERLAFLLDDSACAMVVTTAAVAEALGNHPVRRLDLDDLTAAPVNAASGFTDGARGGNLCHIIYTSGSTGRPKGVAIQHRSVVALISWAAREFSPEQIAGVLASTSVGFDLAVFEILFPLACGGRVILAENALHLRHLAAAGEVTMINTVPSVLTEVLQAGALPPAVRTVCLAGEPLPSALVQRLAAEPQVGALYNLYGPTEDTTYSTVARVALGTSGAPPIGRPLAGSQAYVVDDRLRPVPPGVAGEIYLAGEGLARGYVGRPDLTAERFVPCPFQQAVGARMYRTGDRARYRPDGQIEYLGRTDHQVKLRGFRIEPGEIDEALRAHPSVQNAVVLVRADAAGDRQLVAYVAVRGPELDAVQLRRHLARTLPAHMVPAAYVWLPALPLTANGKIDRAALAALDTAPALDAAQRFEGPEPVEPLADALEEIVAGAWAEVLGRPRIGATDDFFELGGHSLSAVRVVARLERTLGVALPLRALFESPTVRALADRLRPTRGAPMSPLQPAPDAERSRLSHAQQRLWFLHRLDPLSAAYNMANAVRIEGPLDAQALERALAAIVGRHELLRARFVETAQGPQVTVDHAANVSIVPEPVHGLEAAAREAEVRRMLAAEAGTPFDLARGPLLRARLFRLAPEDHVLALVIHHIVSDGWSMGVLVGELAQAYEAFVASREPRLPAVRVRYGDWAAWQRGWLEDGQSQRQLEFWRRELRDLEPLDLPTDRPRPARSTGAGASLPVELDAALTARLQRLARAEGATLHMVLLAAFAAVLGRWSGQRDIGIGTPVANRTRPEVEGLIGCFVNSLVVRADLGGRRLSYRTLLSRVREAALRAQAHQDIPFDQVVECLQPARDLSRTPLFQAMFVLQNTPATAPRLAGLKLTPWDAPTATSTFDLTLSLGPEAPVGPGEPALQGYIEYSTELFEADTLRRFWRQLCRLLVAVADQVETDVHGASLLEPHERERALDLWSGRRVVVTGDLAFHLRFARQAAAHPDRVAVVHGERRIHYRELDARSDRLAARLAELGIGPESRVGLCVERSPEMVVGMLAALKAGGAFVPLDVDHPDGRLAQLLDDAQARVVLTTKAASERSFARGRSCVVLDADDDKMRAGRPPLRQPWPGQLAYVIYTSGTTGRPKGVMVSHGALSAAFEAWDRLYELSRLPAHAQMAGIGFDVCVGDVVRALGSGARLVVCDRECLLDAPRMFELLEREQVAFGDFLPAVVRPLAAHARATGRRLQSFVIAAVGADVWTSAEIPAFRATFGARTRLANSYGVTEATIDSTCGFLDAEVPIGAAAPPIGVPMSHTTAYVLDVGLQPVPSGVTGELYLGGPAVARGYAGQPDRTAERFLPDPYGEPGSRLYRTGDRARWLVDGRIVFAGRADGQVKIRGVRLEPAEVEVAVASVPGVSGCVVAARPTEDGTVRLAAWVVPQAGVSLDAESLRAELRRRIPEALVPSAIVLLAALPLTPNGKVDRQRLPTPDFKTAAAYEPPQPGDEQRVAAVFAEVLGLSRVGAGDDFFLLGGHSLLATSVVSRLRTALGVELPLRALFEAPTVRGLAACVGEAARRAAPSPPPVLPASTVEREQLSFGQQRLWFLHRLQPASAAYNLPSSVQLDGDLDADVLRSALSAVVARHEALRTRFEDGPDGPRQRIELPTPLPLALVDLSELADGERHAQLERLTLDEARQPFDLSRGPLLRATLVRLDPRRHRLLLTMHHIAADGWSMGVLLRELGALYGACLAQAPSPLPELAVQYADWAAWQRAWLRGGELQRQLEFWRAELAGIEPLVLPGDRPRPARPSEAGAALNLQLPPSLRDRLNELARSEGVTLHMVLLAAYAATLSRWSGCKDFAVGTPVANRRSLDAEGLIGFFVNTLPVRVRLQGRGLSFRELLGRVRAASLGAYAHQDLPFERLVEELEPTRMAGHNPIVQTLFALQNAPVGALALPGLRLQYEEPETGVTRFDVELFLGETDAGLEGVLHYSTELLDSSTVMGFVQNFQALLEAAVEDPARPLTALAQLAPAQRHRLLVGFNARRQVWPDPPLVHTLFERAAAAHPDAIAVRMGAATLCYGRLNACADALAHRLRVAGVGPDQRVAVCVERSFEMIVALLATLKAGAAYVPVDPAYPAERIAWILDDARPRIVLTQRELVGRLPVADGSVWLLDKGADAAHEAAPGAASVPADRRSGSPDALVYVVYTSGSTGRPKGVAMSHRAISNLLSWQRRDSAAPQTKHGPRTLQFASLSFDVSFQEIFSTLTAGGELVLTTEDERRDPARLLRLMQQHEVARIFVPFVALDQLANASAADDFAPAALREVATAGEQLRITPKIAAFFARMPGCRLVNHYGPSETHLVTVHELVGEPVAWAQLPPIGKPIPNAPVYLLDKDGDLAALGAPAEVYVGGAGLARGYHARPDLTAAAFLPDPFAPEPGQRMYRTGDLARMRADGVLEFLGRRDLQVKIRGYRVEPGEIEAVLERHPAVRQAAVVAREHRGGKRLAAWVVLDPQADGDLELLREYLRRALPEYMVPAALASLPSLPVSPNGKVDRAALPVPDWTSTEAGGAPRTPEAELVCGIFADVLDVDRVGAHDDFFALGGHSLLATQVVSRLRKAFRVELPLRTLFEAPTPLGIAAAVALLRSSTAPPPPPLSRCTSEERRVASFAQARLWFLDRLAPDPAAYNLPIAVRLEGVLDVDALERALARLVQRHEALRTRFAEDAADVVAVVDADADPRLERVDLSDGGAVDRETPGRDAAEREARRQVRDEAARPFDLAAGPLWRAKLLRLAQDSHVLCLVVHHIAADGWSLGVLVRELGALYTAFVQGEADPLPPLPLQYGDWATWQRTWLQGGELERQLAYWREALAGAPAQLLLPTDRIRPQTATAHGASLAVQLDESLRARLLRFARAEGATLHMTLLAAYAWTLLRSSGQRDVVVGTPVANRRTAEAESLVGFFVNTLAVRVRAGGDGLTFCQLLARVREASLDAYAHQDVPFERVVEALQPQRALDRSPLFQTAFALQNARLPRVALAGVTLEPFEIESDTAKFDLMLTLEEVDGGGLAGGFEYNTDLFDSASIADLAARFVRGLEAALGAPQVPLGALDLLAEHERELLDGYSRGRSQAAGDEAAAPRHQLLHSAFEHWVARTPDAVALVCQGRTVSYAQLEMQANQLAHRLRELGVGPERRVALLLERSERAIVAVLGALKAAGAYLPLDPQDPEQRLRQLAEDAAAAVVVTERNCGQALSHLPRVHLDDDALELSRRPTHAPQAAIAPSNLAYVIFTSGSTGHPKGVAVEHRQIAAYVHAAIARLAIEPGWRFGLVSTLAADLGHTAIFAALSTGGSLHVLGAERAFDAAAVEAELGERGIDALKIVPSHLQALLGGSRPQNIMPRRLLILGGEATPGARLPEWSALQPGTRVANHYGPTETTVGAVAGFPIAEDAARASLPLGRPLSHARAYVLDAARRLLPPGAAGELFLGGVGVTRGYLGRPDLTAARYLPDPFADEPGARMYRTGDRARWLRDGRLEFLGRADDQVKVRGFRVEPGEVAAVIAKHPQVQEAVVVARPDTAGGARLVAYVVPRIEAAPVVHGRKRRALAGGPAVAELNRNETDYLYREIFELRPYVRHGITLRDGDTIFDVGANIGMFSIFASLVSRPGRLFAFEPNVHLQPILRANAAAYAGTAPIVLPVGLADRPRTAQFTFFPGFSLLSGLYADARSEQQVVRSFLENQERAGAEGAGELAAHAEALLADRFQGETIEVPLRTLSDVIDEHAVERIHLLKLNVEKAELDVLRGIRAEHWPRIDQAVVEVDRAEHLAPILALFEAHGFQTLAEQDPLLVRTELRYVYAVRRGSGRALAPGAPPSATAPRIEDALLTGQRLRAHAATLLPAALQPSAWALLEALPLTKNGKLDRAGLPEPATDDAGFVAPRGELEHAIARIWAEVLGVQRVGVHQNFFDAGGHSLLLVRVHSRLRETLGAQLSVVDLFRYPTIALLAARLAGGDQGAAAPQDGRERGARRRELATGRAHARRQAAGGDTE